MTRNRARRLRSDPTDAERLLWRSLRQFKREGLHFRRQVPIGPFIADFACHSAKLIVELDGSQHGDDTHAERDAERTAFLESEGYRVLRIWNGELLADPQTVAEFILDQAKARLPAPPQQ